MMPPIDKWSSEKWCMAKNTWRKCFHPRTFLCERRPAESNSWLPGTERRRPGPASGAADKGPCQAEPAGSAASTSQCMFGSGRTGLYGDGVMAQRTRCSGKTWGIDEMGNRDIARHERLQWRTVRYKRKQGVVEEDNGVREQKESRATWKV